MVATDPSTFARNSINMIYTPKERPNNFSGTTVSEVEVGEIEGEREKEIERRRKGRGVESDIRRTE